MLTFIPDLSVPEDLPPQVGVEDKFGGLPWGLPQSLWPICRDCGKPQSLLAQFTHHEERLDLGRPGRVMFVFQCDHDPGMCETWAGGSGANACFVVEPESLRAELTTAPNEGANVERELRVADWTRLDDGIRPEQAAAFVGSDFDAYMALPAEVRELPAGGSRLGGVPFWIQGPDEAPQGTWRFVGQLDSTHNLQRAPLRPASGVYADPDHWQGRTHWCEGPNFGDGGMAYLFLNDTSSPPQGWFFWQCG